MIVITTKTWLSSEWIQYKNICSDSDRLWWQAANKDRQCYVAPLISKPYRFIIWTFNQWHHWPGPSAPAELNAEMLPDVILKVKHRRCMYEILLHLNYNFASPEVFFGETGPFPVDSICNPLCCLLIVVSKLILELQGTCKNAAAHTHYTVWNIDNMNQRRLGRRVMRRGRQTPTEQFRKESYNLETSSHIYTSGSLVSQSTGLKIDVCS